MDRLTHAEVGGPYSNREDAERAIRAGSFDQDPAELSVEEGDGDDTSKEARRTAALEGSDAPVTDPSPTQATPDTSELPDPMPDQQVMPKTTKPAQMPGGAGGLPQNPMDPQFDPGPMGTPGPDPLAAATASVVEEIRATNPEMDAETLIRVASRAVAKLVEADFHPYSMMPHIEDPLANKQPWQLVKDVKKTVPGQGKQPSEPASGDGEEDDDGEEGSGSSLPFLPIPRFGEGAGAGAGAAEGAGAAAEGAGMARLLPMLMV